MEKQTSLSLELEIQEAVLGDLSGSWDRWHGYIKGHLDLVAE